MEQKKSTRIKSPKEPENPQNYSDFIRRPIYIFILLFILSASNSE